MLDLHADRPARPSRSRKSLTVARDSLSPETASLRKSRSAGIPALLKTAFRQRLIALVLFSLMVGVRTEAGSDGQLTYWTRFGRRRSPRRRSVRRAGSIVIELLRQWIGPAGTEKLVPPAVQTEHVPRRPATSHRLC